MMTKQKLIDFSNRISDRYKTEGFRVMFHLSGGNEDQLIDIFKEIKEGDYVFSTHRNNYHALLHGLPENEIEEKVISGRSMYIYDRKRNFFVSAIIGGTVAIAAGVAWALKQKKSDQKVWCFIGDGTEDSGHFYEAARYVDGWDLPCTFIIEDNDLSVTTAVKERWGTTNRPTHPACVKRYCFKATWPHIRLPATLDLSKIKYPDEETLFPPLKTEILPNFDPPATNITVKEGVIQSMVNVSKNNGMFIGYGVKNGNAMNTLNSIDDKFKLETPVAENLMAGLAIGMSFEGFRPVVYYDRHDFMLIAADSIINHMNQIERISHGEYTVPVILRTSVADGKVFYSGPTHSQNFTEIFRNSVTFPVYTPTTGDEMVKCYNRALASKRPTMIVERKSHF